MAGHFLKLKQYFDALQGHTITLSFADIENILGSQLPKPAYEYISFWCPDKADQIAESWLQSGWRVENVKLGESISFIKVIQTKMPEYKIEVYLSKELVPTMVSAATNLGACKVGDYENVASYFEVEGCWKPKSSANPFSGKIDAVNYGREYKLELRCKENLVRKLIKTLRNLHPYEEALINVIPLANHLFEG